MSGVQSLLIAGGTMAGFALWLVWALHPWARPRHAATSHPPARHLGQYDVPGFLPAPVTGCACGVVSGEHKVWCADADAALDWAARNELPPPGEWTDKLLAGLHDAGQRPRGMVEPAGDFGAAEGAMRAPGADPYPEDGAGDESEACGPPAPPAPPDSMAFLAAAPLMFDLLAVEQVHAERLADPEVWGPAPADVENARVDAFIAEMRADMAAWLASARERWAAA